MTRRQIAEYLERRRRIFRVCVLICGLLIFDVGSAQATDPPSALLVNNVGNSVWRVLADGSVEKILAFPPVNSSEGWYGGGGAIPSRDRRIISYGERNDVWLLDLADRQKTRITDVGMPSDSAYASVSAWPLVWSWDSARLIYRVSPGDRDDPEGRHARLQERKAQYGYYVYELANKTSIPIPELKGNPICWLPGDKLLIWLGNELSVRSVTEKKPLPSATLKNASMQVDVGGDGRTLIATLSEMHRSSQIATLELEGDSWRVSPVSPLGKFAEYQWPSFSPSGQKYAFIHQVGRVPIKPGSSAHLPDNRLVVGDKIVYAHVGSARYAWITDRLIALLVQEIQTRSISIVVVDSDSGRQISRHEVSGPALPK